MIRDHELGETACRDCGLITAHASLDRGPEWRAFDPAMKARRVGTPTSYCTHDKSLPTVIAHVGQDASRRKLPSEVVERMYRLRKLQYRAHTYDSFERNLAQAMSELDRLASALSIPDAIKERAALIYRKALKEDLVRGRTIAAITAAALYASCRLSGTPRSLSETAFMSKVSRRDVAKGYRLLAKTLDLIVPVPDPLLLISSIASKIGADSKMQQRAIEILRMAKERELVVGKVPTGLAAMALYMACVENGVRKTQREIAEAAAVTEVTIRNLRQRLRTLNLDAGLESV